MEQVKKAQDWKEMTAGERIKAILHPESPWKYLFSDEELILIVNLAGQPMLEKGYLEESDVDVRRRLNLFVGAVQRLSAFALNSSPPPKPSTATARD